MASFSLVHGAWHGAWCWDLLAAELHLRGHEAVAVDLPCDDTEATLADYAAVVPDADIVVGHSLGGLTIPLVPAAHRVYLGAFVPVWGEPVRALFAEAPLVPGFPDEGTTRDEHGRTVWVDDEFAISSMYNDCELTDALQAYARLRPQAGTIYAGLYPLKQRPRGRSTYVLCSEDRVISADWARRVVPERLGGEPVEFPSGHSPMLSRPSDLANLLNELATEESVP